MCLDCAGDSCCDRDIVGVIGEPDSDVGTRVRSRTIVKLVGNAIQHECIARGDVAGGSSGIIRIENAGCVDRDSERVIASCVRVSRHIEAGRILDRGNAIVGAH